MKTLKIEYTLGERCALNFKVEGMGTKTVGWDSTEDMTNECIKVATDTSFEVIYQAQEEPCLVLGINVPHDTVVDIEGNFQHCGHMVVAIGDGTNYDQPVVSQRLEAGEQLSKNISI